MYCFLYFLVGFGYLTLTSFYNGLGETKTTLKINLITFSLLFALSPVMTGAFGVLGLIAAILFANATGQIYSSYYARKRFQVKYDTPALLKIFAISVISSVIPLLIVNFTQLPMFIGVALGAGLYLALYITLIPMANVITLSELQQVMLVSQKIRFLSLIAKPVLKYQHSILRRLSRED
jgi:O-antigen/teichoic acid export membrane protein